MVVRDVNKILLVCLVCPVSIHPLLNILKVLKYTDFCPIYNNLYSAHSMIFWWKTQSRFCKSDLRFGLLYFRPTTERVT